MVLEQLNIQMQKKKKKLTLYLLTKINSKLITDLNVKCKTIKLLEDSIGENLVDLEFGKKILDTAPKESMKEKYYLDFIKIKNSCCAKDTVKIIF